MSTIWLVLSRCALGCGPAVATSIASAAETLDTYSHLWPDSDDRTREAVDSVLSAPADSLRTGESH